jgi:hypothetical protein
VLVAASELRLYEGGAVALRCCCEFALRCCEFVRALRLVLVAASEQGLCPMEQQLLAQIAREYRVEAEAN